MGTGLPMVLFRWTLVKGAPLMLLVVLFAGYGFAWTAHAFVERNRRARQVHRAGIHVQMAQLHITEFGGMKLGNVLALNDTAFQNISLVH